MPELDTAAWYAFGVPLYLALVGLELSLGRRRRQRVFDFAETISNLTAGLSTLLIGLFVGPWVLRAWDAVHASVAPFPWPGRGIWKLPAALVLADFCYYAYHRAGHRFALFWAIHGIHHQHECQNSSVGFRLEWLADPYAALFFGLMPLAGVDSTTGFAAIALLSLYTLTAHTPVLARPTWGFLITPAIHGSHHSRDSRYSEANYGAMLGVWDRAFGTWIEPPAGEVLRSDHPSISRSHNGVTAQWGLVVELGRELARSPSLAQKWALLTSRPIVRSPASSLRSSADIPIEVRGYVLVQFVVLTAFSLWILWFRSWRSLPVQLVGVLAILLGLWTLGEILDGRRSARGLERGRLVATAVLGAALGVIAPIPGLTLSALSVLSLPLTGRMRPG